MSSIHIDHGIIASIFSRNSARFVILFPFSFFILLPPCSFGPYDNIITYFSFFVYPCFIQRFLKQSRLRIPVIGHYALYDMRGVSVRQCEVQAQSGRDALSGLLLLRL